MSTSICSRSSRSTRLSRALLTRAHATALPAGTVDAAAGRPRNRDGFRVRRPPGDRASDQDRKIRSRARVTPTYSSRRSSSIASSVCAYTIGSVPSVRPGRKTTSHSSPLAACSEARVTPCMAGACSMALRRASSATNAPSAASGWAAKIVLGELGQRLQRLPALPGRPAPGRRRRGSVPARPGCAGPQPAARCQRPARHRFRRGPEQPDRLTHLRPVEEPLRPADLAGHARARPGPAPAPASARWSGPAPPPGLAPPPRPRSASTRAATADASSSSSGYSVNCAAGPAGRWATSAAERPVPGWRARPDPPSPAPVRSWSARDRGPAAPVSWFASAMICGVDR